MILFRLEKNTETGKMAVKIKNESDQEKIITTGIKGNLETEDILFNVCDEAELSSPPCTDFVPISPDPITLAPKSYLSSAFPDSMETNVFLQLCSFSH